MSQGSLDQWQTVFFLSAGIYAATDLFYVIFGTGVEQPWNQLAGGGGKGAEGEATATAITIDSAYYSVDNSKKMNAASIKGSTNSGGNKEVGAIFVVGPINDESSAGHQ